MKYFAATILLIALLAQNCSRWLVLLNFELNKDFIAKNLCENRNKPKSCCKGKCFLKKQLNKADKEEGAANTRSNKEQNEILFFVEEKNTIIHFYTTIPQRKYSNYYLDNTLSGFYESIYQPPRI